MQAFDEKNEPINFQELKSELQDIDNISVPTEQELERDLEMAYQQGNSSVTGMSDINFAGMGANILKKLKKIICALVGPGSSSGEIIDAILDALVTLIPGGVILKPLVKKIAKFIFDKGIAAYCQV